jgi:hypothetical protein
MSGCILGTGFQRVRARHGGGLHPSWHGRESRLHRHSHVWPLLRRRAKSAAASNPQSPDSFLTPDHTRAGPKRGLGGNARVSPCRTCFNQCSWLSSALSISISCVCKFTWHPLFKESVYGFDIPEITQCIDQVWESKRKMSHTTKCIIGGRSRMLAFGTSEGTAPHPRLP